MHNITSTPQAEYRVNDAYLEGAVGRVRLLRGMLGSASSTSAARGRSHLTHDVHGTHEHLIQVALMQQTQVVDEHVLKAGPDLAEGGGVELKAAAQMPETHARKVVHLHSNDYIIIQIIIIVIIIVIIIIIIIAIIIAIIIIIIIKIMIIIIIITINIILLIIAHSPDFINYLLYYMRRIYE